jgi:co-chaperonin GroES (HSP10)
MTETKTKISMKNGEMTKTEVPVFKMPTEVRTPNFKPEGRILLCDAIPFEDGTLEKQVKTDGIVPGRKDEYVTSGETTASGIILSAKSKNDSVLKAIVNAVGDLVTGYEIGDIIVYKPNPTQVFLTEIEGHKYIMMEQYNIIGKYLKNGESN